MSWDPKEPEKEWTGTLRFNATEGNVDHRNEFTPHTTRRRKAAQAFLGCHEAGNRDEASLPGATALVETSNQHGEI